MPLDENRRHLTYLFRNPGQGKYSIENVFDVLIPEVEKQYLIKRFYTRRNIDIYSVIRARSLRSDIFHITGAVNYLALGLAPKKTIITVHDLGFYENPIHAKWKQFLYGAVWFRIPLRRCRFITTVSEFTKSKILEHFDVDSDKIHVIPNPVSSQIEFDEVRVGSDGYLNVLQIGSGAHKNLRSLILAVRDLSVRIIIVGYPSNEELDLLKKYHVRFEIHQNLRQTELLQIYKRIDVLFFASFYEGFGLPILEAQKMGRAVITSNFGAMKEVSNGAAILIDPSKVDEIRSAIIRLMNDKDFFNSLVKVGRSNASGFSAESVASKYVSLYARTL